MSVYIGCGKCANFVYGFFGHEVFHVQAALFTILSTRSRGCEYLGYGSGRREIPKDYEQGVEKLRVHNLVRWNMPFSGAETLGNAV